MIIAQHSNFVSPLNKLFTAERALYLSLVYPDLFCLISLASRHYLRNNSDTHTARSLQSARPLIQHCCVCCVFLSTVVLGSQCNTDTQFYDSINPRACPLTDMNCVRTAAVAACQSQSSATSYSQLIKVTNQHQTNRTLLSETLRL